MGKYLLTFLCVVILAGCDAKILDDSTYVLVRQSSVSSALGLRAYFIDGDAKLNGTDCRELLTLANEAVERRQARGEIVTKYECVSLREARERGFK
jgi:hypothetical protein